MAKTKTKNKTKRTITLADLKAAMRDKVIVADISPVLKEENILINTTDDSSFVNGDSMFTSAPTATQGLRKVGGIYLPQQSDNSTSLLFEVIAVGSEVDKKYKLQPKQYVMLEFVPPMDFTLIKLNKDSNDNRYVRVWSISPTIITAIDNSPLSRSNNQPK